MPNASAVCANLAKSKASIITNAGEREQAQEGIEAIIEENKVAAKTERDEYLEIVLDCISSYEHNQDLYKEGLPPPQSLSLDNPDSLRHLREDGFKGSEQRQIRLVKSATFKIQPKKGQPNLLMKRLSTHR